MKLQCLQVNQAKTEASSQVPEGHVLTAQEHKDILI